MDIVESVQRTVKVPIWTLGLAVLIGSSVAMAGNNEAFVQRDVPVGMALNLQDYDGPNISVIVTTVEPSSIAANIFDYTQLVPTAQTSIQGVTVNSYSRTATVSSTSSVVMMPTRNTHRVEKNRTNAISFNSRWDMYLLYEHKASGLRVYLLDAIAPQNMNTLVVRVPPAPLPPPPQPAPPTTSAATEPIRQAGDGVISSELLAWYLKLQRARHSLDTNDTIAVARFNQQAAEYHDAVKMAREIKRQQCDKTAANE